MPMELLQDLLARALPCRLSNPADIEKLHVLQGEALVTAHIPPPTVLADGRRVYRPAMVIMVTAKGRKALGG